MVNKFLRRREFVGQALGAFFCAAMTSTCRLFRGASDTLKDEAPQRLPTA